MTATGPGMARVTHFGRATEANGHERPLCGQDGPSPNLTSEPDKATCKKCRKILRNFRAVQA